MAQRFVYSAEKVEERPLNWSQIRRLLGYMAPYRREVWMALLATLVGMLVRLAAPQFTRWAIDLGILGQQPGIFLGLFFALLVIWSLNYVTARYRIRATNRIGLNAIRDLRADLYRHVMGISLRFFDTRSAGAIFVRIQNDVNGLQNIFTNAVIGMILDGFTLLGILVIMFAMNWRLALVGMVSAPFLVLIVTRFRQRLRQAWQVVSMRQSRINAHLNEAIQGMRVTQAFHQEEENAAFFAGVNAANRDGWLVGTSLSALFSPLVDLSGAVGLGLLYLLGARLVGAGEVTAGMIYAFGMYTNQFWEPINRLSVMYNQWLQAMASSERVFEFLDEQTTVPDRPDARVLEQLEGRVALADVTFSYQPDRPPALRNLSLEVEPGETIALVGQTGSGKSTLINLLCRFYDPTEGQVLIDGHDIRDLEIGALRRQIGMVLQESFIFAGTVMENIRFAKPEATEAEVEAAARAAQAHGFITRLPNGYQTEVEERGSRLSLGQRQLIAFSRALLADPRILILDEATANIDTETEAKIQAAVDWLLEGRTAFVIAHRLSTIRNADRIVVMEQGQIVEIGSHDELMARQGYYHDLVTAQYRELKALS